MAERKRRARGCQPSESKRHAVIAHRFPVLLLAVCMLGAGCSAPGDWTGAEADGGEALPGPREQDADDATEDDAGDTSPDTADEADDTASPTDAGAGSDSDSTDSAGSDRDADDDQGAGGSPSTTVADGRTVAGAELTSLPDGVQLIAGEPVDAEIMARLTTYVERHTGRVFPSAQQIDIVEADGFRSGIPEGVFVNTDLWDLLLTLGLVSPTDDRLAADAVRRESVRGVCCPLILVDDGEPLFNEVVIVHELTHGIDPELIDTPGFGSEELIAPARALLEGNAHRIAFNYATQLNNLGADLPGPPSIFDPGGDARLPVAVQQILEFAYDEGHRFAVELAGTGGEAAIFDAFADPPSTSEQILDVEAYLAGEDGESVARPTSPAGAEVLQSGVIGAFVLSLLVEPELGTERAQALARTWAGDSYVLYEQREEICIDARIVFDQVADAELLVASLQPMSGTVVVDESMVSFANCSLR